MVAVADAQALYFLQFADSPTLLLQLKNLQKTLSASISTGHTPPLDQLAKELELYFAGKLHHFSTPLALFGTLFQRTVWNAVIAVPSGETRSYGAIAKTIELPTAFRAVANANKANKIAIIIPCHRIIKTDGSLSGYNGQPHRKEWLLSHEKNARE